MVKAAIIGLGWWGRNIVNSVQGKTERIHFVRGISKEPDAARDLAQQHGFQLSTDLEDALNDPGIQAVVLATPHSLHADQIVAASKAGKHVFCEKPLSLKRADALRAVEACRKANVVLGVGTNKRFWPAMPALKRVVESGRLGQILHVEAHYSNENSGAHFSAWRELPTESPGGGMTGSGLHVLDALVNLAGPVRRVRAQLTRMKPGPDPYDTVSVMYQFVSGVSGTLAAVRATPFYWRVHVFGRNGSAEALGETELVVRLAGAKPARETFEPVDALRAEFDAFADAVDGRAPFPIPMAQMVDVVAAFEATVDALDNDREVMVFNG